MTTPTTPTPVTRYFQPGTTAVYWITTLTLTAPTIAQVTATTSQVLQADIAAVNGFLIQGANIEAPDLGKRFNTKVPGRITASDSSITFYASRRLPTCARSSRWASPGYIAFFANGAVTGSAADYYKVTVNSVGRSRDIEAVPTLEVMFSIVDYNEGGVYPTS
jgi:Tfp pilus assembly protein PilX